VRAPKPAISAVVTSYNEEHSIDEFHRRLSDALATLGRSYEIILVDDGSSDNTFDAMKRIFEADDHVAAVLDFTKNAGQLAAMTAGLCEARGDAVLFLDSDLQLAPEDLPKLVAEYDRGCDLVTGYREDRRDSLGRVIPSKLANLIMRKVSGARLRDFGCTFKLYNARVLRAFDFGPFKLYDTARVIARIGSIREVPVRHFPRKYGKSGWTFSKLWQLNMENIVNLSQRPFQILGALCLLGAFLFVARVAVDFIYHFQVLEETTHGLLLNAIVVVLLILVGILCIIGEFTVRAFVMGQRYPYYIIREKLTRAPSD
jgi:glycosyltransferase involved in cell wall biosynthesis